MSEFINPTDLNDWDGFFAKAVAELPTVPDSFKEEHERVVRELREYETKVQFELVGEIQKKAESGGEFSASDLETILGKPEEPEFLKKFKEELRVHYSEQSPFVEAKDVWERIRNADIPAPEVKSVLEVQRKPLTENAENAGTMVTEVPDYTNRVSFGWFTSGWEARIDVSKDGRGEFNYLNHDTFDEQFFEGTVEECFGEALGVIIEKSNEGKVIDGFDFGF